MHIPLIANVRPGASGFSAAAHRADARSGLSPRHCGFSIIELVVVLVITSTIASVGALRYSSSLLRYRLEGACNRLIADIADTRTQARSSSSQRVVQFDPSRSRYAILTAAEVVAAQPGRVVTLADDPYRATFSLLGLSGNTLRFDRFGAPDGGGIVTVRVGNRSAAVVLEPGTGRAYVAGKI